MAGISAIPKAYHAVPDSRRGVTRTRARHGSGRGGDSPAKPLESERRRARGPRRPCTTMRCFPRAPRRFSAAGEVFFARLAPSRETVFRPMTENEVAKQIVDAAFHVHPSLGPGLLESAYEAVLAYELEKPGLHALRQQAVSIVFQGPRIEVKFRADPIVEDMAIVEIESVETVAPVRKNRLPTHPRLAGKRPGLLIDFNVVQIEDGIARMGARARRVMPFGAWAMAHFPSRRRTWQKPGVVARGRPGEENSLPRSAPAGSPGETHRRSAQPRGSATIPSPLCIMRRSGAKMRFGRAGAVNQPGTAPKYRPWPAENTSSRCKPGSLACRQPFRGRRERPRPP
jgi:GxxExxY protein